MTQEEQPSGKVLHEFTNIISQQSKAPDLPPEVPSRRWLYWQMTRAVAKKVVRAPFSVHTWGALRRTLLANVLPDNLVYRYKAGSAARFNFNAPSSLTKGLTTLAAPYTLRRTRRRLV
jgi:hypothetical protein